MIIVQIYLMHTNGKKINNKLNSNCREVKEKGVAFQIRLNYYMKKMKNCVYKLKIKTRNQKMCVVNLGKHNHKHLMKINWIIHIQNFVKK